MLAATYATRGDDRGVLRVEELPDPEPAAGEVRVRVHVSGVNPTDWKARLRPITPQTWDRQIPNQDGAGVVDAVGAGVDEALVGRRVWVYHAALGRPGGTAAQYVCLPREQVIELPDEISFDHGAGLGIPGMTAHRCVFGDGPVKGLTLLITGGAGAVGHAAVQLARWGGARVLTTVSTDAKAALAEEAGADVVLRYRDEDFPARLAEAAEAGIHRVVEVAPAANLSSYVEHLAAHAVVMSYARDEESMSVPIFEMMARNLTLRFMLVYTLTGGQLREATADLDRALRQNALRPLPTRHFTLDDIAAAHDAVREGFPGKVLVDVP